MKYLLIAALFFGASACIHAKATHINGKPAKEAYAEFEAAWLRANK